MCWNLRYIFRHTCLQIAIICQETKLWFWIVIRVEVLWCTVSTLRCLLSSTMLLRCLILFTDRGLPYSLQWRCWSSSAPQKVHFSRPPHMWWLLRGSVLSIDTSFNTSFKDVSPFSDDHLFFFLFMIWLNQNPYSKT